MLNSLATQIKTTTFSLPAEQYRAGETIVVTGEVYAATVATFQLEMPSGTAVTGTATITDTPGNYEETVTYEVPTNDSYDITINLSADGTVGFYIECEVRWGEPDTTGEKTARWVDNPNVIRAGLRDFASYSHIDDPNLQSGFFLVSDMGNDVLEYGYWKPDTGYVTLGWSWLEDGERVFGVPDDSPLTEKELALVVRIHEPRLENNWTW